MPRPFASPCLSLLVASCLVTPILTGSATAQPPGVEVAELREQLESGLKARRPEEFEFIEDVVGLVSAGDLPLPLVRSTFHWARKKARFNGHAFQYFEQALRIRTARFRAERPRRRANPNLPTFLPFRLFDVFDFFDFLRAHDFVARQAES